MTAIATTERPAGLVADYHALAIRWWTDKVAPHGPECRDLPCSDLRAYLKRAPLDPPSIAELVARGVTWLPDQPCGCPP